jgi:hypothetical protein
LVISDQGKILDKVAEGLGVEEVRRTEAFSKLEELIDKVKNDMNRVMDKRKLEVDNSFRDIRKDMQKMPAGGGKGLNSTGKNSN